MERARAERRMKEGKEREQHYSTQAAAYRGPAFHDGVPHPDLSSYSHTEDHRIPNGEFEYRL